MKEIKTPICLVILLITLNFSLCLPNNPISSKSLRQSKEFSEFSYRSILFQTESKDITKIQTDKDSSPLRVSREELGRFTWAFLHSTAAAYPKLPTEDQKLHFKNLLWSIVELYPCRDCGEHFRKLLTENPVEANSREQVIGYVCHLHNLVNVRLNKDIFDCKKAAEYWGGDCGCDTKAK